MLKIQKNEKDNAKQNWMKDVVQEIQHLPCLAGEKQLVSRNKAM